MSMWSVKSWNLKIWRRGIIIQHLGSFWLACSEWDRCKGGFFFFFLSLGPFFGQFFLFA